MTKRVLVVDNGIKSFQYMIVDFDGDFKTITRYRKINCTLHDSSISQLVVDVFKDNRCDEIYMDAMGTSLGMYESLPEDIKCVTHGYKMSAQSNHNRMCDMMNDFKNRNIFIEIDSMSLYDVIKVIGNERSLYQDSRGLLKIDKNVDWDMRDKLHIVLGMYKN